MSHNKNDQPHPHTDHNIHQGQEPRKDQDPNDPHTQPHNPKHTNKHDQPHEAPEKPPGH